MMVYVDSFKKLEPKKGGNPSASFTVLLNSNDGGLVMLSGFRILDGRIHPPSYRGAGGHFWPICYLGEEYRTALYTALEEVKLPEGVPTLKPFDEATVTLIAPSATRIRMFPTLPHAGTVS